MMEAVPKLIYALRRGIHWQRNNTTQYNTIQKKRKRKRNKENSSTL
jgi:hypothetical protein